MVPIKDFDQKYFSTGNYANYLNEFEKQGRFYANLFQKNLQPATDWQFLDLGCGPGGLVLALTRLGFESWGVEPSAFARKEAPSEIRERIKPGRAVKIPFSNKKFEVISCIDVFCYLNTQEIVKACQEIRRVGKEWFYLENIVSDSENASQEKNPDPLREESLLLTDKRLISLVEQEGFKLVKKINLYPESGDLCAFFSLID